MKKIILVGAAPIDGKMQYPSEGAIDAPVDQADALIEVGLAKHDDLDSLKVDEARALAQREGAPVGPAAVKAEIVAAIRDRRENKA